MSEFHVFRCISNRFYNLSHPILLLLVVGLIIRFALMSLAVVYDADYWALVIRNIEAGQGLYEMEGYFYTPIWGYFLGIVSAFQSVFMNIGELAVRVVEMLPFEGLGGYYISATVPSLAVNYSVKLPLVISDVILAYLVYILVKDMTHSQHKAVSAFALVFLCPLLIGTTSIIGMPDTISATFTVLTLILARREKYLLAGMSIAVAILTKFFPVFLVFILAAYVLRKHHDEGMKVAVTKLLLAVSGALLMTLIVFMPQIIEGTLSQCFQFITDRTGSSTDSTLFDVLVGKMRIVAYIAVLMVSVYLATRVYRSESNDLDSTVMMCSFASMALCMIYPPAPQYLVIVVPFIACAIAMDNRRFMLPWKVLFISAFLFIGMTNSMLFLPLAVWTDLISVDTIVAVFNFFQTSIGSVTLMDIHYLSAGIVQYVGIILMLGLLFGPGIKRRIGGVPKDD